MEGNYNFDVNIYNTIQIILLREMEGNYNPKNKGHTVRNIIPLRDGRELQL